MKYNRKSLIKACEDLIAREDFRVQLRTVDPKDATAHVEFGWDEGNGVHDIDVTLDPSQGGLIESLLHECLHMVLHDIIAANFNGTLEEVIVKELERNLWVKGMKAAEVQRWRSIINDKLEKQG